MPYDIHLLVKAITDLHDTTSEFLNRSGYQPSSNSQANVEIRTFPRSESVITVYSQGDSLIEVAADQLMAFAKTVTEPAQAIAPWTCVRAVIESCALACWLLTPGIDVKTRVQRSFAFRYEGLCQQIKFGHALGDETNSAKVMAHIIDVESVALRLGFPKLVNRKGKRSGIGQLMPSVTELVNQELNEEAFYRLTSAMAHAHNWALLQLSFRRVSAESLQFVENTSDNVVVHPLEKNLEPISVAFLCYKAAVNFVKPIWYKCQLFGWNHIQLENLFDAVFNSMGIQETQRCWKDN
jgi:hypothetical protein